MEKCKLLSSITLRTLIRSPTSLTRKWKLWRLLSPRAHSSEKKISLEELFEIPLVARRRSTTLRALLRQGYRPNIAVECDVSEAVKAAVQRELGVGILYRDTVEADLKNRNLKILHVPDLETIRTQSFIIYNRYKPLSAITQDFLNVLQESRVSKVQSGLRKIAE